ncbi:MAG TPA: hypothetical protein PKI33_03655 [Anaerolineales bacterium]|nr:hypothetical protein [Anaerolineales bacterium]HNM36129.1 hypothetical protein [Anaerolineales bacterium]
MVRKIGTIVVFILAAVLLVYSATRSLDFISLTLPEDRKVLAYFGLAALDGGLVAWILSYLYGSKGWQRAVSFLMVLVDLVGAIAMFTLDTLYNTGKAGMTEALTPSEMQTAVLGLSGVIALNIAAAVAHHLTDPEKLREQAEEDAFSKVEDATLKQISKNADSLAAQLAPTLAQDWMNQTRSRYMSYVGTGQIPTLIDSTAQNVPASSSAPVPFAMLQDNPKQTVSFMQFLPAWLTTKFGGGRKFEAAVPAPSVELKSHSEMFLYKCPSCGWEIKTPEKFTNTKPCMNCDGFIELQTLKPQNNSLYEAFKQGIAEAQGVESADLHSPLGGSDAVPTEGPEPK